jgi:hypothetical protein
MRLPNARKAVIEQAKIVDYLLNASHPDNGGKARFFMGWGFTPADWQAFAQAIVGMVGRNDVALRLKSSWGEKYVVDGALDAPGGTTPPVRTIWIVDGLHGVPRLVTAYPTE